MGQLKQPIILPSPPSQNLPIAEIITITTATTTHPKKRKQRNFQNGETFFILDIVSTRDI